MERKVIMFLKRWKNDLIRKPLLMYGPKQVGKTYAAMLFGKEEYKNVVYFNTMNNKKLKEIFARERSTEKIIVNLSLLSGETILANDTLIIFDNVDDVSVIKGIKLFGSEKSDYHIITITSRRENLKEFKGEELQFKGMYEMDFEEYLWARGEKQLADLIRYSYNNRKTCPFHNVAFQLFNEYLSTGGYPEVVKLAIDGVSDIELDATKQKILDTCKKELLLNKNLIDITRGLEVISSIPYQLMKENKKFQYGLIGKGRRAKEYEGAIEYLVENQLVCRSYKITSIKSPLSSCREKDSFKLYLPDDGLLYSMMHVNKREFMVNESIRETMYENHIAKTLFEAGFSLYYYQSGGKAEVNFVIQNRMGEIIPIEIATRAMSKVKSLSVLMKRHTVTSAIRITENNFSTKKEIRYIPVYAIFCLNDNLI